MRALINGLIYDTEKATKISWKDWAKFPPTLYMTPNKRFFAVISNMINPLSNEEALKTYLSHDIWIVLDIKETFGVEYEDA